MIYNLFQKLTDTGLPVATADDSTESVSWSRHLTDAEFDTYLRIASPETYIIKIRIHRNKLLLDCDWTQLSDVIMSDDLRARWLQYRQALRDIPQNYPALDDVIWPAPPEV